MEDHPSRFIIFLLSLKWRKSQKNSQWTWLLSTSPLRRVCRSAPLRKAKVESRGGSCVAKIKALKIDSLWRHTSCLLLSATMNK